MEDNAAKKMTPEEERARDLDSKLARWNERRVEREKAEAEHAKQLADMLRHDYMLRTGRKEMKP